MEVSHLLIAKLLKFIQQTISKEEQNNDNQRKNAITYDCVAIKEIAKKWE